MLGGGIGLDAGEARPEAGARGDGEDAAVALALHRRRRGLRQPEGAVHVGFEDDTPIRFRNLADRPADLAAHATRGMDEDIEPAGPPHGRGHGLVAGVAAADVEDLRCDPLRRGEGLDAVAVGVRCDDGGARRLQRPRDRLADALRRAGDQGRLAVEADQHAASSSSKVERAIGFSPSSMAWISSTSRSITGVATPTSRPSRPITQICGSISVRRLRTARSR